MANKPITRKIESINVVMGREIPEELRLDHGIDEDSFVEIRVERENPAKTEIVNMGDDTPGRKFSRLIKKSGITF